MARRVPCVLLMFVLIGVAVAGAAPAEKPVAPKQDYYELYKLLVDTLDQVERNYVKDVDRRELIEAAIEGVLEKLDPYSAYIGPEQLGQFRSTVESQFGGIGVQISVEDRKLKVISPLVGTPAYRAGLIAGDYIVEIDGEPTEEITIDEAVRRLKGKPGTKVALTVIHPDTAERLEVEIAREEIHVETVLGDHRKQDDSWQFMLKEEQHIGYIRVTAFSRDTAREIRKVLEQLTKDKLRGLILDLRFNPGGLLSSAIEVSDMFIPKGRIVSTKGRNSPERTWDAKQEGTFQGFPVAVLVNRYSASASEIVAACLQDHKRAVVVGERTWGKGSVQNVIELEEGASALKLTTAAYRRPSGKNIHRFNDSKDDDEWGVAPDEGFDIKLGDAELLGLIRQQRDRDIVRPNHANQQEAEEPEKPEEPGGTPAGKPEEHEKPPFIDRQLQKALEHLTDKLARAK